MKPLIYLDGPDMQIDITRYPGYGPPISINI